MLRFNPDSNRVLSEDYHFCQHCRKLGVKVWMYPWIQTVHVGTYQFQGNLPLIANHLGEL